LLGMPLPPFILIKISSNFYRDSVFKHIPKDQTRQNTNICSI
jgi:hypothetical protein